MIVNNAGYIPTWNQAKPAESSPNVAVVAGNNLPAEKNASHTVLISEAARSKMFQELKSGELVDFTGENGPYKKGLMALGESTLQEWAAKGLNISEEAIIAAGRAYQDAFSKMVEESGASLAGSSLALNKHQIIINAQDVPDWFTKEYERMLSSMEDKEMESAFEKGDLAVTSKPSPSSVEALANYASVARI